MAFFVYQKTVSFLGRRKCPPKLTFNLKTERNDEEEDGGVVGRRYRWFSGWGGSHGARGGKHRGEGGEVRAEADSASATKAPVHPGQSGVDGGGPRRGVDSAEAADSAG